MVYPSALFFFYCPSGDREQIQSDLMTLAQEVKKLTNYDLFVNWSLNKHRPSSIQYACFSRTNYFSFEQKFHQEIEDKFISFYESSINCIGFLAHDFEIYKKFFGKEGARSVIYSNKYLAGIISSIILGVNEGGNDNLKNYDFLGKTRRSRYFPGDVWPILINQ